MLRSLKKQFYVQWENEIMMIVCILAGFVIGMLLFCGTTFLITSFDGEASNTLPMGTMFGCILAVMFIALSFMTEISVYFNMEVSMGCTRIQFFTSFYIVYFVFSLLNICLLLLLCTAENGLNAVLYPHMDQAVDFIPLLAKWGVPVSAAILMIFGFFGVLMMRIGRKAFWIMWVIWMFAFIGIPQIGDSVENAPDSVLGRFGTGIMRLAGAVPVNFWISLTAVLCLISFAVSYLLIRRQHVTS